MWGQVKIFLFTGTSKSIFYYIAQEQVRVYFIILQVCASYIPIGFLLYVFGCRISILVGPSLFY